MRNEKKYTTQYMADILGISKTYYSQLENNRRRLSYDMAIKIAEIFNVHPDHIFYKDHIDNNS